MFLEDLSKIQLIKPLVITDSLNTEDLCVFICDELPTLLPSNVIDVINPRHLNNIIWKINNIAHNQAVKEESTLSERIMQLSETRYRRIFEEAVEGIFILNGKGKIVDINPPLERIFNTSKQEVLGRNILDLVHDGIAGVIKYEYQHIPALSVMISGLGVRYLEVRSKRYLEEGHTLIQCHLRDVTQNILKDHALQKNVLTLKASEERFRLLTDLAPLPILVTDIPNIKNDYANKRFLEITGFALDKLIAIEPDELLVSTEGNMLETVKECGIILDCPMQLLTTQGYTNVLVNSELASFEATAAAYTIIELIR